MHVEDRIYGKFEVDSPVLIELIASAPLQRLKGIAQFGVPDEFYHLKSFSRYEHCVGVMLLLRKLDASEEEQIAGLLHDASHTAFSHIIDWVLESRADESYQDRVHLERLVKTELPGILERHGYSLGQVCDYHRFGLLEHEAPDLCADRIDYGFREFDPSTAAECLPHLITHDGRIIFDGIAPAKMFATSFLELQKNHWGGFEGRNRYLYFSEAIRRAIELGDVKLEDFEQDDAHVVDRLTGCRDDRVRCILEILRLRSLSHLPPSRETIPNKFRHVDPLFVSGGTVARLSETDADFRDTLGQARRQNAEGARMVVI
jgi:uncharacterized protein